MNPDRSSGDHWLLLAVGLVLCIAAAVLLRLDGISRKHVFSHDEAISYLSATCHQGSFERADFGVTPVPASRWKKFLRVEDRLCFGTISADLAATDIHPPLYFWLLHLWVLIFGVHVWSGPALNVLISVVTIVFLFGFAYHFLKNGLEALLVSVTYALNPGVASTSFMARPYELLGLLALLTVAQTIRCVGDSARPTWLDLLLLFGLSVAGSLTHYHFVLVVAACAVLAIVRSARSHGWLPRMCAAALLLGPLASFLIHPPFESIRRAQLQRQAFDSARFSGRVKAVVLTFEPFGYLALAGVVVAVVVLWLFWKQRARLLESMRRTGSNGAVVLVFFAWISTAIVALYLTFRSPAHAMQPRYMSLAFPFLVFLPALLLRTPWLRRPLAVYLFAIPILIGVLLPLRDGIHFREDPIAIQGVADLVVIDNTSRGVLPTIVWHVPDDQPVIATMQDTLFSEIDSWLVYLGRQNLYVTELSYGNTSIKLERILRRVQGAGFEVAPVRGRRMGSGAVISVRR